MKKTEIEHLWIVLENGVCAIHSCYTQNSDNSPFLSELKTIEYLVSIHLATRKIYGNSIKKIQMKEKALHFLPKKNHLIVVLSSNKLSDRKVNRKMKKINKLLENSCSALNSVHGDVNHTDTCYCRELIDSYLDQDSYSIRFECKNVEEDPTLYNEVHETLEKHFSAFDQFNTWKQVSTT
jgi:predicted DNA-binding ArsR family transcriptional regulator